MSGSDRSSYSKEESIDFDIEELIGVTSILSVVLLIELLILVFIIETSWKSYKKNNRNRNVAIWNFLKTLPSIKKVFIVAVLVVIAQNVGFFVKNYLNIQFDDRICSTIMLLTGIFTYNIAMLPIYLYMWTRQNLLHSSPVLRNVLPKWLPNMSKISLLLTIAYGLLPLVYIAQLFNGVSYGFYKNGRCQETDASFEFYPAIFVGFTAANQVAYILLFYVTLKLHQNANQAATRNQNRIATVDAYDKVDDIEQAIEDLISDNEMYWQFCLSKMRQIKAEADSWKSKVAEEENQIAIQRENLNLLTQKIRESQIAYHKNENAYYEHYRNYMETLKRKERLEKKKSRFLRAIIELRDKVKALKVELTTCEKAYQEQVNDLLEELEDKAIHIKIVQKKYDSRKSKKRTIEASLKKKKQHLESFLDEGPVQKSLMLRATDMLNTVIMDLSANRAERMWYKEHLIMVADARENMEKIYAKDFAQLKNNVLKEEVLQDHYKKQIREAEELLAACNEEIVKFRMDSYEKERENRSLYEIYQRQKTKLIVSNHHGREEIKRLKEDIIDAKQRICEATERSKNLIIVMTENIKNQKAKVEEMSKEYKIIEQRHSVLKGEYEEAEREYKNFAEMLVKLFRAQKETHSEIELHTKVLDINKKAREHLKETILSNKLVAIEQLGKYAEQLEETAKDINEMVGKHKKIHEATKKLIEAGIELEQQTELEIRAINFARKQIHNDTVELGSIRERFETVLVTTQTLNKTKIEENEQELEKLSLIKKTVERRTVDIQSAILDISHIIEDVTKFENQVPQKIVKSRFVKKDWNIEKSLKVLFSEIPEASAV